MTHMQILVEKQITVNDRAVARCKAIIAVRANPTIRAVLRRLIIRRAQLENKLDPVKWIF